MCMFCRENRQIDQRNDLLSLLDHGGVHISALKLSLQDKLLLFGKHMIYPFIDNMAHMEHPVNSNVAEI